MPILPDQPTTPMDPVAGFFAGINSSVTRTLLALATVFVASIISVLCAGARQDVFWFSFGLFFAELFVWGSYGGWFFVGLFALIGMIVFLFGFVFEHRPALSFFLPLPPLRSISPQ